MTMTPHPATLQQRTVDTIKQAHDLLSQQAAELNKVSKLAAASAADTQEALPTLESIITKLSTSRVDGVFLVPPNLTDKFLKSASTKAGLAHVANQLADMLLAKEASAKTTSKTASSLGDAVDDQEAAAIQKQAIATRGFGALPSRNIRM